MKASEIGEPLERGRHYGYSCQTVLSKQVNEFLHQGTYRCWVSLTFNPSVYGNSSNPLWLYQTLWHAVETGDGNDAKINQIRTALMEAVSSRAPVQGNPEAAEAIVRIRHASVALFRPQIWRIDLSHIGDRATASHQYPGERLVEELKCQEFDIVIE